MSANSDSTFTCEELDDLAKSLREKSKRLHIPQQTIHQVYECLQKSILQYDSETGSELTKQALRVLVNYVADVPDNAQFVYNLMKDVFPIVPSEITKDYEILVDYQLILITNIITTNPEAIDQEFCQRGLDDVLIISDKYAQSLSEINETVIMDLLEAYSTILTSCSLSQFMLLMKLLQKFKREALSEDIQEDVEQADTVMLAYSKIVHPKETDSITKERNFMELYQSVNDSADEKVLLNATYDFKLDSPSFLWKFLALLFDGDNGTLEINEHVGMSLLLLSNEILNEQLMREFMGKVDFVQLMRTYFGVVYPAMDLKNPWELQSIALFNKAPIDLLSDIPIDVLENYGKKLKKLINATTLQVNKDVVTLQLKFLSKVFASAEDNEKKFYIIGIVDSFSTHEDYKDFPTEFKTSLIQFYLPYLFYFKGTASEDVIRVTRKVIENSKELLDACVDSKEPLPIAFLIELSKVYGIYVEKCYKENWYESGFNQFQKIFEEANEQLGGSMPEKDRTAWKILENNIRYAQTIMQQHSRD